MTEDSVASCRMKQEQSEQKRADEKARRDHIFQQYLARKAEREIAEEESKAGISTQVPRRPRQQGVLSSLVLPSKECFICGLWLLEMSES